MDNDREQFNAEINARLDMIERKLDFIWREIVYQDNELYKSALRRDLENCFDFAKPTEAIQRLQFKDTK